MMIKIGSHIDDIHFFDCDFEEIRFGNTNIVILATNVGLMPGHPLNPGIKYDDPPVWLPKAVFVFDGVKSSKRMVYEYAENAVSSEDGFKSKYEVVDGPFNQPYQPLTLFTLEGVLKNPHAWVAAWEIEAVSFSLQMDEADLPAEAVMPLVAEAGRR